MDPHETVNVYYNTSYSRVTQALKDYLHTATHAYYRCNGTACP